MYETVMDNPLIITGSLTLPVGWSAAHHRHPHPELILVTDGAMEATVADQVVTVAAGGILLYPPGVLHHERNAGRRGLGMIYVHAGLPSSPTAQLIDRGGRIGQLVRWLAEDQAAGAPPAILSTWVTAIGAQLGNCANGTASGLVDAVRSAMRADLARPHRASDLARGVGLGERQFLRRYRAAAGTTPMADLRRMRCEAAAGMLATTGWPLQRIATSVGFCDAFHLSKAFRRRYGLPPVRMRSRGGRTAI